jgi:hypothetical protein
MALLERKEMQKILNTPNASINNMAYNPVPLYSYATMRKQIKRKRNSENGQSRSLA